jgi:U3 small nucleolar RNA-associated protein 13
MKTFEGHANSVLRVTFVSRGTELLSSSSDGLLKVWNIKTNECVNTFDVHTDKVWALAVRKDEEQILSGGADSVINIWQDFTMAEEEERQKANEERILRLSYAFTHSIDTRTGSKNF